MKITIDISLDELVEVLRPDTLKKPFESSKPYISPLFYGEKDGEGHPSIKIGDKAEIRPSENCVTNADKIQYNELTDGKQGFIVNIDTTNREVTLNAVTNRIIVHPHWLKLISRK